MTKSQNSEVMTHIKYIRESLESMRKDMEDIHEKLNHGEHKIQKINKTLYGNGDEKSSIVYKVRELWDAKLKLKWIDYIFPIVLHLIFLLVIIGALAVLTEGNIETTVGVI